MVERSSSLLQAALPVQFRFGGTEPSGTLYRGDPVAPEHAKVSSFGLPHVHSAAEHAPLTDVGVTFLDHEDVPFAFRGRSVRTRIAPLSTLLCLKSGETALATCDRGPLWAVSKLDGVSHFRSALSLPALHSETQFQDLFNGSRFLELLPLVHWLRQLDSRSSLEGPALRACFILDDPNLHWRRYGFVNFAEIARHAESENYHVSFATIPLDSWFTHKATASLFRANTRRLSLSIHGNNHIRAELGRRYTGVHREILLHQALARIQRLERSAGLSVCRVMVPPHGACSEEMLRDLPKYGFEAACISHGSLRAHNQNKSWTASLGYLPSEIIGGCPVLPRWAFATRDGTNTILLAAFLRQPIILRGHHQDLKGGIELLDEHARVINSLGAVEWMKMADIARTDYMWRMEDRTLVVMPLSQKLHLVPPKQSTHIVVENPFAESFALFSTSSTDGGSGMLIPDNEPISLVRNRTDWVRLEIHRAAVRTSARRCTQLSSAWPLVRRMLTEVRDRLSLS